MCSHLAKELEKLGMKGQRWLKPEDYVGIQTHESRGVSAESYNINRRCADALLRTDHPLPARLHQPG